MPTDLCNDLIQRARQYEQQSTKRYHAQGIGETESWYGVIHHHLERTLLPEIKRHDGELFVEYWPVWLVMDRERELRPGVASETLFNYEYGTRGTGYVCVTNRNAYIVVLKELTDQFPMTKPSLTGFLLDALSKEIRHLRPFTADRYWAVSPSDIRSLSIASDRDASERIKLVTASGTWEVYEHFFDQRGEIYAALECLRSGGFSSLRPKYHVTRRPRVLSEAELLRSRTGQPAGFSFLPEALDPARAARGLQLLDLHYLAAEVAQRGGADVELDLAHAAAAHPSDPQMQELRRAFAGMRHLLDHCDNADEVLDTLHVRIDRNSQLSDVYHRSVNRLNRPYFRSLHPLPDTPHPALIRTIEIGELHNPEGFTSSLDYSWGPYGNSFVTGGNDGIVRIWSLMTGAVQEQFWAFEKRGDNYSYRINRLVLSPDSKILLTVSLAQGIKAWNTADWTLRYSVEVNHEVRYCAFDASGAQFAYCPWDPVTITIFDAQTGRPKIHKVSFESLQHEGDAELGAFKLSPSGEWALVLIVEEEARRVHRLVAVELSSGEELFAIERPPISGFTISPRGDYIVDQCAFGGDPDVWDIAVGDWASESNVRWGEFSPSGKLVALGLDDGTIKLHDARSGAELHSLSGHLTKVRSCKFSPDERFLLSMDDKHVIKLWDLTKANQPFEIPKYFISGIRRKAKDFRSCDICAVNRADDSVLVAGGTGSDAAMLDSATGKNSERYLEPGTAWYSSRRMSDVKLTQIQQFGVRSCAISADGESALFVNRWEWAIFDTRRWNAVYSKELPPHFSETARFNACALSSNRQWVAISVDDEFIMWNVTTGQTEILDREEKAPVQSCLFDPDGQWIMWANGGIFSSVQQEGFKLRDLSTGSVQSFHIPQVARDQQSPFTYPALSVWGFIQDLAVTPDRSLVLAAHRGGTISVWEVASLRYVNAWRAHESSFPGRIACAAMPDNRTVLTTAADGAVKLWDIETGKCLSVIRTEGAWIGDALRDCDVFPDGWRVVAVGETGVYWLEIAGGRI